MDDKHTIDAFELIKQLKAELKRERFVVDFYATEELYERKKDNLFKSKAPSAIELDQGAFAKTSQLMRKEFHL